LLQAMLGFHRSGKVNLPKAKFDSEKVRYEHRFAPFKNLSTPPAVQYPDFRDTLAIGVQQPADVVRMYVNACKHFHQARCLLEAIPNPDQEVSSHVTDSFFFGWGTGTRLWAAPTPTNT